MRQNPINNKIQKSFGTDNGFWLGTVVGRNDPLQIGRVRVRMHGYHTSNTSLIPDDSLPWSNISMPSTEASFKGVGKSATGLMIGTEVWGIWLDGDLKQQSMIIGVLNQIHGEGIIDTNNYTINQDYEGSTDSNGEPIVDYIPDGDGPSWFRLAKTQLGIKEFSGNQSNPDVLKYHKVAGLGRNDNVPWCSAFVMWVLKNSGNSITGLNGLARSHSRGAHTKLTQPKLGCIVVFSRPPNKNSGHVAFFAGIKGGRIIILGGNQSDAVTMSSYSAKRVIGYYWPKGA